MPHLVESAKHKRPDVAENLVDFDVSLRERYVSKLRPLIKAEAKKNKYGHKTFGEAEVRVRKPKEFLRKNTRITPPKPEVDQCHGKGIGKPVPPVPKHVVPKAPVVQEKNFRADNVVNAMRSRARQPVPRYVLTRRGDTRPLEPSGTVPRYALKKGLKKNWEEAETAYQRLPLIIETPSMLRRKIMLEKKLTQLENDITFLEKHEYIYIYDDENSS
ncbi:enkurin isoform X3 [Schistocerca nitens]|uniref:enkurin isoform X3 n=1 Tax=Schistocerca nitens TaxID=7011 RepID=UPI0021197D53|nr:enkurin isoform X3 [Schistocerca nitens]